MSQPSRRSLLAGAALFTAGTAMAQGASHYEDVSLA